MPYSNRIPFNLQSVIDHEPIHAELQGDHEDQQDVGKDHGHGCQPGAPLVPPQVTPGQTQAENHRRGFRRLERVKILAGSSRSNSME